MAMMRSPSEPRCSVRIGDLLAAKAELERQQSTVKGEIGDRILSLLLIAIADGQLTTRLLATTKSQEFA